MSASRRMLQNFEPHAWASYQARDAPLAASSRTDGCEDASTRWGSRPRSLAPNARPPAGSAGAGRPLRLTVSDWTRASPSCTASGRPFLLSTSTCQARRPGIQSNSHLRLDAAASILAASILAASILAASILAGEARPWQPSSPYACMGRYVALATAPSRDIHCAVRPSRRRNAIP
jgi:hypothetical protein